MSDETIPMHPSAIEEPRRTPVPESPPEPVERPETAPKSMNGVELEYGRRFDPETGVMDLRDDDPQALYMRVLEKLPERPKPEWFHDGITRAWQSLANAALKDELQNSRLGLAGDSTSTIRRLSEADRNPPPPLLFDRLAPGDATVLFGPGDIGKGTLASSWISQLQKFENTRVLILDYEGHIEEWARRIYGLSGDDTLKEIPHVSPLREWGGPIWSHAEEVRKLAESEGATNLVIDSAGMACSGTDPSKPEAPLQFNAALQIIGLPSLTLAHVTKLHEARYPFGSVYWHNVPRLSWSLMPKGDERLLVCRKANNYRKPGAATVTMTYDKDVLREVWEKPAVISLEDKIEELLSDNTSRTPTEIAEALNEGLQKDERTSPTSISGTLSRGLRKHGGEYRFSAADGRWFIRGNHLEEGTT